MISEILKNIDQKKDQRIEELKKERDERILVLKSQIKEKIARRSEEEIKALRKENSLQLTEFSQRKDTEINFLVQREKNKIIQVVWDRAKEKIDELPEKEFTGIINSFIRLVPKMEGTVLASKRTHPILKKNLKNPKLKIKEGLKEEGFIVEGKNLELNFTISETLEQMKEEYNPEIIKILFSD